MKVFNGTDDQHIHVVELIVQNKIHRVGRDLPTTGTWEIDVKGKSTKTKHVSLGAFDSYTFITPDEKGEQTRKERKETVSEAVGQQLEVMIPQLPLFENQGLGVAVMS